MHLSNKIHIFSLQNLQSLKNKIYFIQNICLYFTKLLNNHEENLSYVGVLNSGIDIVLAVKQ